MSTAGGFRGRVAPPSVAVGLGRCDGCASSHSADGQLRGACGGGKRRCGHSMAFAAMDSAFVGLSGCGNVPADTLEACLRTQTIVAGCSKMNTTTTQELGRTTEDSMNEPKQSNWRRTMSVSIAGAAAATLIVACGSDSASYQVLASDADIAGSSVAEVTQVAGKWIIETPLEESWLGDPSRCDAGASTSEVYYAPSWAAPGDTTVSCTMSADQALFLSPVGLFCVEDVDGAADESCFDQWDLTSSSVSIDGADVGDMNAHQYDSEPFDVSLPAGNIFEADPVDSVAIFRGQPVLVKDLPKGEHVVVLAGDFGDGEFAGSLTINLTVE